MFPDRRWHWFGLSQSRLQEFIKEAEVRIAERGFAFLQTFDEEQWNSLSLHALVGDEETVRQLAFAARGEAEYRGFPKVEAMIVDKPVLNCSLTNAGYRREGGIYIYEQAL